MMPNDVDDSFVEFNQLEKEVQQTETETQNFTQSHQEACSQVRDLEQQISEMNREMSHLQGTIRHLMQVHNNTQPPVTPTPHTPHSPYNPSASAHPNPVAGTPQSGPPVPPRNIAQNTPQGAPAFIGTESLSPIRAWPASHNLTIPTPFPNPPPAYPPPQPPVNQTNPPNLHQSNQTVIASPSGGSPNSPLNNTNPFLYSNIIPMPIPQERVFKLKDVGLLKLSELRGVSADNRLNTFFRQVESCTSSDEERKEVALTKSEPDIAALLTAELAMKGNNLAWDEMKRIMKCQFLGSATLVQAWQEVNALAYYFDEPPSSFVTKLQCRIAALTLKFPNEQIPTSDKFLKTKIYEGLSSEAQARLVDFLADHIPLEKFMLYAEEEYYRAQGMSRGNRNRTMPISGAGSSQSPTPVTGTPQVGNSEIDTLTKEVRELSKRVEKISMRTPQSSNTYCAFCRVTDHNLSACPHNPPRGVCFDCHRPNSRRGHTGCPGQANKNNTQ
ncbi:uncharacterized protein LOC143022622 [Oratosquilla oratoria]|uniref:uncharacterized protein LOC143022622 n=1 Tax=Oratosquilla oratoria TaxID=337810 RepID=UPI003F76790C